MKKQRLGRGLDAIFETEKTEIPTKITPMSDMNEISISQIMPNPNQPRKEFEAEALAELSESISTLGIIQPITLRQEGNRYIIISGERRWRASQMAGLTSIPAYVRQVDDEQLHAMALVENLQREDLNPVEIALGLQRLLDECSLTQEALSEKVSMKRPTISNYLRLLNLPEPIQLAIKGGVITMGHAKALAGITDAKQQVAALKKCVEKSLSVRQIEELARKLTTPTEKVVEQPQEEEFPENYTRLVEHLEQLFTRDISIKRSKNGGGKITIDFNSDADIEKFIKRLSKQ